MALGSGPDAPLFPPVPAVEFGWLPVDGGHRIYFETCGPPHGLPVLFLHGGPGSGCNVRQRQLFDPARYRAILVDQRGCGRSEPLGATETNTTQHLVDDLETLRRHLGVPRWIVFGGSWGSTLALAYGQRFPQSVLGMVIRGIFLGSRNEIDAYLANQAFSVAREPLLKLFPAGEAGELLADVEDALNGDDWLRAEKAARAWLDYENAFMGEPPLKEAPNDRQKAKVRVQLHYLRNDCFLAPGRLLAEIGRLRDIPAAIVQGLRDPVCPPQVADILRQSWPEAEWYPVGEGGHGGLTPPIAAACLTALDEVAGRSGYLPNMDSSERP